MLRFSIRTIVNIKEFLISKSSKKFNLFPALVITSTPYYYCYYYYGLIDYNCSCITSSSGTRSTSTCSRKMNYNIIDIGANLTDGMYQGIYHAKKKHQEDLDDVLDRSFKAEVEKIFVTGGSLSDCRKAVQLCTKDDRLFCTVGCHPTRCLDFEGTKDNPGDPEGYLSSLLQLITDNNSKVIAIGECGLDYDRLHFCDKETQIKYFRKQFDLADQSKLPMFLHCRNAAGDMKNILEDNRGRFVGGVIHSFTGSKDEAQAFLDMGLYIGINGCSLKTEENVETMKSIPAERLMIETDAPWCEVKRTHASYKYVTSTFPEMKSDKWQPGKLVKGRNEPVRIVQVLEAMAGARGMELSELARIMYDNTKKLFFPKDMT